MTFEQWMDRQYGKNWGVTMAAAVKGMKDAWFAGRASAYREAEKDHDDAMRDCAAYASHAERYPDEPPGTY